MQMSFLPARRMKSKAALAAASGLTGIDISFSERSVHVSPSFPPYGGTVIVPKDASLVEEGGLPRRLGHKNEAS